MGRTITSKGRIYPKLTLGYKPLIDNHPRCTLEQYLRLIKHGYDGDRILKWTKVKAAKMLNKLKNKS